MLRPSNQVCRQWRLQKKYEHNNQRHRREDAAARFFLVAGIQRLLDTPLAEDFLQVTRYWYAHVPAVAASAVATAASEISVIWQRGGTQ